MGAAFTISSFRNGIVGFSSDEAQVPLRRYCIESGLAAIFCTRIRISYFLLLSIGVFRASPHCFPLNAPLLPP